MSFSLLFAVLCSLIFSAAQVQAQVQESRGMTILTSEQREAYDRETLEKLQMAVRYLERRPKEIENYLPMLEFRKIRALLRSGSFEKYEHSLESLYVQVGKDKKKKILLQPHYFGLLELAEVIEASRDIDNTKRLYSKLYKAIPSKYRRTLTSPKVVNRMNFKAASAELLKARKIIIKANFTFTPIDDDRPDGWTLNCMNEIGAHSDNTVKADRCSSGEFHSQSLFNHSEFPLKYYHTCIKSQGATRGTCVAFTLNAALESKLMVDTQKAYNFSEQFTFYDSAIRKSFSGRYKYGLYLGKTINRLRKDDVKFQFENNWKYNFSKYMEDGPNGNNNYPFSCSGYNSTCSGHAFQTREDIDGLIFKTYTYYPPSRSTSGNFKIRGRTVINSMASPFNNSALDEAILLLNDKEPLLVSFKVKEGFKDYPSSGRIRYSSSDDHEGGHAALLLGFIPNRDLPSGVPNAAEKGYFIMKNSWGIDAGDCGYFYVDFKYLRKNMKALYAIEI